MLSIITVTSQSLAMVAVTLKAWFTAEEYRPTVFWMLPVLVFGIIFCYLEGKMQAQYHVWAGAILASIHEVCVKLSCNLTDSMF